MTFVFFSFLHTHSKGRENETQKGDEINEGSITKITDINFIGNQNYSDRVLRSEISTSRSTWIDKIWGTGRSYDNAIMEYDKELLAQFYRDNGYINFNVVNAIGELNNSTGNFVITFTVDEGDRYLFGDISILNMSSFGLTFEAYLTHYLKLYLKFVQAN